MKNIKRFSIKVSIVFFLVLPFVIYALFVVDRWLSIDTCLDMGLIWDDDQNRCRDDCEALKKDLGCIPRVSKTKENFIK